MYGTAHMQTLSLFCQEITDLATLILHVRRKFRIKKFHNTSPVGALRDGALWRWQGRTASAAWNLGLKKSMVFWSDLQQAFSSRNFKQNSHVFWLNFTFSYNGFSGRQPSHALKLSPCPLQCTMHTFTQRSKSVLLAHVVACYWRLEETGKPQGIPHRHRKNIWNST